MTLMKAIDDASSRQKQLERRQQELTISPNVVKLFESLVRDHSKASTDVNDKDTISIAFFRSLLVTTGLKLDDPRLNEMQEFLNNVDGDDITVEQFAHSILSCLQLVESALKGHLHVPDFRGLSAVLEEVYNEVKSNEDGANASYIDTLARVDPSRFAISFCSVDGQRFDIGDSSVNFCLQSCSFPINYLVGIRDFGAEYVHEYVGHFPSTDDGRNSKLSLKERKGKKPMPDNPLINAGAILAGSMVYPEEPSIEKRLGKLLEVWSDLTSSECKVDQEIVQGLQALNLTLPVDPYTGQYPKVRGGPRIGTGAWRICYVGRKPFPPARMAHRWTKLSNFIYRAARYVRRVRPWRPWRRLLPTEG